MHDMPAIYLWYIDEGGGHSELMKHAPPGVAGRTTISNVLVLPETHSGRPAVGKKISGSVNNYHLSKHGHPSLIVWDDRTTTSLSLSLSLIYHCGSEGDLWR
jgi:hypothetical protein